MLDLALELVALSVDLGKIVVGELAPLLLCLILPLASFQFPSIRFQSIGSPPRSEWPS